MKTVSSICAAGSLTALSAVGLALARPNEGDDDDGEGDRDSAVHTRHPADMAAVAPYHFARNDTPFTFSSVQQPRRLISDGDGGRMPADWIVEHKRHSAASKGGTAERESESGRRSGTPSSWMRRLSSNMSSTMSTSRDSSRAPTSRPASAAFSYSNSNGSAAVSHSGSTTPVFTPTSRPPNKLVKRTASSHSTRGSPFDPAGSRLPVLRRPATSHQRSATLQETHSSLSSDTQVSPWRHYFTPRTAAADATSRRGSTGIPNPIKRVFPDRRYYPTLISSKELVRPVVVEFDSSDRDEDFNMAQSTASSPFPHYAPHFEESAAPRRSFSISDLLSNSSQPRRMRPASSSGRPWSSRSLRTSKTRVVSEPQAPMGTHHSRFASHELERPAKRRVITDPQGLSYGKSSPSSEQPANHDTANHSDRDLIAQQQTLHTVPVGPRPDGPTSPSIVDQPQPQPTTFSTSASNPARLSASISETASLSAGSDSDAHSLGDNSTDYQSDNVYDSYPTRTTRSSSGRRGPHIETIFDESPPSFSSGRSTKLRDFLSDGQFPGGEFGERYRHSTIEEEDSVVSTPVRSLRNKSVASTPSARPGAPHVISSSPPTMNIMADPEEMDWDAPADGSFDRGLGIQQRASPTYIAKGSHNEFNLPFRFGPNLQPAHPTSGSTTPQRNGALSADKANLFDWAEQQPSPSHASDSPQRPRTVHGKKDQDSRWSRPAGRRGPSGMHARSHSVPVVPDLDGKRDTVTANKFGTWGVGSKAVTEDWNEDFDFDEMPQSAPSNVPLDERRIDSGHEMFVPKSIREQQENVVANIGLLREWGLLIEELKELRIRAVGLDMLMGPYRQAWQEVDAMIELADQESEEHTLEPRGTPPSSPGFDYSAFEEQSPLRRSSASSLEDAFSVPDLPLSSINQPSTPQGTSIATRPRKDSELVAQRVIAALQSRRDVVDSSSVQIVAPTKKVPFDTATLRHIVPYVNGLKRRVKDALRETEGLYSSPRRKLSPVPSEHTWEEQTGAPAFRSIFNGPQDDIIITTPGRREQAKTDNDGFDSVRFELSEPPSRTPRRS